MSQVRTGDEDERTRRWVVLVREMFYPAGDVVALAAFVPCKANANSRRL